MIIESKMKAIKSTADPYAMNKQLENAFVWLVSNKYIRTAAELAAAWGLSQATVSEYRKMRRPLGEENARKFNRKILLRHNLTLSDFKTNALVDQVTGAYKKPSSMDIASLLTTQLMHIDGGQEVILDKLENIEREMGELRELVTKLIVKFAL